MKDSRVVFEGEGEDLVMRTSYATIGKTHEMPIGQIVADRPEIGLYAMRHGFKQRGGDFLAQDKELSKRQKEQIAYDKMVLYTEHLQNGGDWKMTGERDTITEVIEAMVRIWPKKYTKELLQEAADFDEDQVSSWRADPEVKHEMARERTRKLGLAAKENTTPLVVNFKKE